MLKMGSGLSCLGIFWSLLSFIAAGAASAGFFLPYWLKGYLQSSVPVYFGVFRRCNYPRLTDSGDIEIIQECGRYSTFMDIPSMSWQIGTVVAGTGCGLALLLAFVSLIGICIKDIITPTAAKLIGVLQLIAGLLIGSGLAVYPNGLDSKEVQQACGHTSDSYKLGECSLYWGFYLTAAGGAITLLCSCLSCGSSKEKQGECRV